jgi:hypothetical protein
MPLSSNQLAALVERARHKAPPVVSPPLSVPSPPRSVQQRRNASAAQTPSAAWPTPRSEVPTLTPEAPAARAYCRSRRSRLPSPPSQPRRTTVLGSSTRVRGAFTAGSTPYFAARCSAANTPTYSSRSGPATPSISARTAGASCWPTAALCYRSVRASGRCSPSCRRAGNRRHRPARSARSSLWNFNWPNLYASRRRFMPVVRVILGPPSAAPLP